MGAATPAIPYIMAAVAAGAQYVNTKNTQARQDEQAAQGIRNQAAVQKRADQDVNATVDKLAASTAAQAREQRATDYMNQLRANRDKITSGLTPNIGSGVFQRSAAAANDAVQQKAQDTAGLMATMDAAGLQRQQEGFDYGQLGTQLGLDRRESQGQQFMDQMRMNAIHRNGLVDLGAGLLSAGAGYAAGRMAPTGIAAATGATDGTAAVPSANWWDAAGTIPVNEATGRIPAWRWS